MGYNHFESKIGREKARMKKQSFAAQPINALTNEEVVLLTFSLFIWSPEIYHEDPFAWHHNWGMAEKAIITEKYDRAIQNKFNAPNCVRSK